jgi:hypothetical protein
VLFIPMMAYAQSRTKNLSFFVNGGYISSGYLKEAVNRSQHKMLDSRNHNCIILNTGIQFRVAEKWRIGPAFSYDHFGIKDRQLSFSRLSYMFRTDRIWKETKKIVLYSGISAGVARTKKFQSHQLIQSHTGPVYHFYAGGMQFKFYHFYLDINIGYGPAGLFNFGGGTATDK